jgi:hypothetical protein
MNKIASIDDGGSFVAETGKSDVDITLGRVPPKSERLKDSEGLRICKLCGHSDWQPRLLVLTSDKIIMSHPGKDEISDLYMTHQQADQSKRLLIQRDIFIANRINATLLAGETGVLFIGVAHNVDPYLASDIFVRRMPGFPTKMSLRGRP